jgi:hypothetical protein
MDIGASCFESEHQPRADLRTAPALVGRTSDQRWEIPKVAKPSSQIGAPDTIAGAPANSSAACVERSAPSSGGSVVTLQILYVGHRLLH